MVIQLNTYVWTCRPHESRPLLGRIAKIEPITDPTRSAPTYRFTVVLLFPNYDSESWAETYSGVYTREELEVVERVSQNLSFIESYHK